MNKTHSTAFLKRRKFLMVLPLLMLPFTTFAFYALGGGKAKESIVLASGKGINTVLPDADFKPEKPQDKMSLMDQAEKDSASLLRQDVFADDRSTISLAGDGRGFRPDPNEIAIQTKLEQITRQVNAPAPVVKPTGPINQNSGADPGLSKDVSKLEAMMKQMQQPDPEDHEMQQLNSMMDKIISIQNPELVKQTVKSPVNNDSIFKAVPAELANNQKALQGSVVELRLLDTLIIGGQVIPKGHSIFGLAAFSNQRLNLEIKNIRLGNSIIPVSLTVFDRKDSMVGINAPEALLTDAINSGSTDAIGSIGLSGYDLTSQLAGAGLEAAKGLLTKKIKRIKQPLKAGYPVLLRDNSRKNSLR